MKNTSFLVLAAALVCGLNAMSGEMTAREKALKAAGLSGGSATAPATPGKPGAPASGGSGLVTVDFPVSGMM